MEGKMSLKEARLQTGYSQEKMAVLIGVSRPTYIKYEENPDMMPIGTAKRFSQLVGKSIDDLFFTHKSI